MTPEKPQVPDPEGVEALLAKVRPEAEVLFRRHGLSSGQAEECLEAALRMLVYKWSRIADPGRWLLQALEDEAARRARPIS
jgi:hypothetical protein